ncbi:MAG: hypothetical protein RLZZ387_1058 [Chloroflexota bacterium]|jgi:signal transduction histidine kinase
MSTYDELRVYYTRPPDERMALLEQEMRGPLNETARLAAQLNSTNPFAAPALFGGRFGELIEILQISSAKLAEVALQGPALREKARAVGGLVEEDMHVFRHDLLTPLGTVRGVAEMLAKIDVSETSGLPLGFTATAEALAAAVNELKDVLDALTETRSR